MSIVISIIVLALLAAAIIPRLAVKRAFGSRVALSDEQLVKMFASITSLHPDTIITILKWIGTSYKVNYSILKPDDCLKSELRKIDSWQFDAGAERLENLVRERFNVMMPVEGESFTISDLMKIIESNSSRS
jgi:hypothetical protein